MTGVTAIMAGMRGGATLSVTAADATREASGSPFSGTVNAGTTATASGGVSPYTYAWTRISTSSGNTPDISNTTAQSPSWSATVLNDTPSVSTWRVTATDSVSSTATHDITVSLTWFSTS